MLKIMNTHCQFNWKLCHTPKYNNIGVHNVLEVQTNLPPKEARIQTLSNEIIINKRDVYTNTRLKYF